MHACLVLDATAKPPSGLLRGASWWIGEHKECLSLTGRINNTQQLAPFSTSYCSMSFGNASHQTTAVRNFLSLVHLWAVTSESFGSLDGNQAC
jgi:hypothetical protein